MTALVVALLVWCAVVLGRPVAPARATAFAAGPAEAVGHDGRLRTWRRWRPGRQRAGTDVVAAVTELGALVRAGLPPATAWQHVARGLGDDPVGGHLRQAAEQVGAGLSPVAALRPSTSGTPPTREERRAVAELSPLAASWAVHERTGAPVADLLDTLATSLGDEREAAQARRAALAAPRATARVLAALPVLGLVLGELIGARPVAVLVGTGPGRISAVVGLLCAVTGVLWTRALLRAALGSGASSGPSSALSSALSGGPSSRRSEGPSR